jgi:sec-independent protein translocase protein TatB
MFDIGWSEMLIIGVVALVVIGPKELPGALKTFAFWMKQARKLAREFQSGVDDMIRTAELDEAKKAVEDVRRNLNKEIETAVDPTGELKQALSDQEIKAPTPSIPLSPPPTASNGSAEPQAAGPSAVEGAPAPEAPPAAPTPEKGA